MPHHRIAALTLLVFTSLAVPTQATAQTGKKVPIPSKKLQDDKNLLIFEVYKQEFEKANPKDTAANASLARYLLDEAWATNDDPAGRYVLLDVAIARAMLGGDTSTVLQAIDELDRSFSLPPRGALRKKISALLDASTSMASIPAYENMIDNARQLYFEALAEDDYPSALELMAAAEKAARNLRSVPRVTEIRKAREEVAELEKKFARWKPFADELARNPDNAEANCEMGIYQALVKGNWDRGLPLLARSSNAQLKNLAQLDLADPSEAKMQVALAGKWFDLAQKNPLPKVLDDKEFDGGPKIQLLLRSYRWYQDALGFLPGTERDRIEQRMQNITSLLPPEFAIGELTTEFRRWDMNYGPVYSAAFSPDSKKVVAAGVDGILRLWDIRSGKELRKIDAQSGRIWSVCFSADGRSVISGGFDGSIRIWDAISGREIRRFSGHADYVRSVVESRDGRLILSGGDDRMVKLWSVDTGAEIRNLPGHEHFVWSVGLSRNGKQAISGSLDKTVRLWDVASGKQLQELRGHKDTVLSVAFTPDGRRALSGSTDKTLIRWDLETGEHVVFPQKHTGYVNSLAVSPDGRRAVSGSFDGTMRLWDVNTGNELRILKTPEGRQLAFSDTIWHVAFSPDGRLALSCGEDGTVRIWSGSKYR